MNQWTKLTTEGARDDLDRITAVMSMIDNGLMIEDYGDFPLDGMYGTLVDETILNADRTRVAVSVFVPEEKSLSDAVAFLRERFSACGISAGITCEGVREEDWAETWKQYYRPVPLGRLTIVPAWQEYTAAPGELIVRMDPGMAFGAGTHETTRLAVLLLEDTVKGGESVLDLGCGSGILSICAAKLGAASCRAYDIDPVAVRVASENAEKNGVYDILCGVSDLLASVEARPGGYDIAVANIVADVLLRLAPDIAAFIRPGGDYIVSGIIRPQFEEVCDAMTRRGFRIVRTLDENDWFAVRFRKE